MVFALATADAVGNLSSCRGICSMRSEAVLGRFGGCLVGAGAGPCRGCPPPLWSGSGRLCGPLRAGGLTGRGNGCILFRLLFQYAGRACPLALRWACPAVPFLPLHPQSVISHLLISTPPQAQDSYLVSLVRWREISRRSCHGFRPLTAV